MVTIPKQLQNEEFRFVLLKEQSKIPFEEEWQKNGYKFNDDRLITHLAKGGNYGVIAGYGKLRILDIDDTTLGNKFEGMVNSFSVTTGRGGKHIYFLSDLETEKKKLIFMNDYGELKIADSQTVGPGCVHPNGSLYVVSNDVELKTLVKEDIEALVGRYVKTNNMSYNSNVCEVDERYKNFHKIDPVLLYTLKNNMNGGSRNNTLFKNMVIGLCKEGLTAKEIRNIGIDVIKNCPGKNIGEWMGWYDKCQQGMSDFNKSELNSWIIEYDLPIKQYILEQNIEINTIKSAPIISIDEEIGDYDGSEKNVFRKLAKQLYDIVPYYYDKSKIWWMWDKNEYHWYIMDETDIIITADKYFKNMFSEDSKTKSRMLEALKKYGRSHEPAAPKKTWIQFNNKIVDIESGNTFDATPKYFIVNRVPWNIGSSDDTPTIDRLFLDWVGTKYVNTLYEIIAYCCLADLPIQRLFCLIGEGSNGKSTFIKLVSKFIGNDNVSATTLQNLINSGFGTTCLYKKLVTTITEVEKVNLKQTGVLKSLSGGDAIRMEFKGKNAFTEDNYSKLILASNKLPSTSDNSDGFMRRWLIIDFPNRFSEKADILKSIPDEEYSNLAFKVVGILKELLKNGSFTNDGEIEDRRTKYMEKSTNLKEFIEETYTKSVNEYILFSDFYYAYDCYCKQNEYKFESKTMVALMLQSFGYILEVKGIKDTYGNNTTSKVIFGLTKLN
jgi:putative DNA primase/helicase